jgi:hypothetical protein
MPRYGAVLDACVLVPIALADTLLRVAEKGLYRPLWSDRILAEAQQAIEEIHPGIDVQKRFTDMREAFDDALVTGWEELETGSPTRSCASCQHHCATPRGAVAWSGPSRSQRGHRGSGS